MKIYEIGTGYTPIPAQMGAATEIVVEELTKSLLKLGKDVTIVDIKADNRAKTDLPIIEVAVPKKFSGTDIQLGFMHKLKRVVYSIALAYTLKRMLKNTKEKVVLHFHNQYNMYFFLKLVPRRLREKCYLAYTNHSYIWHGEWSKIKDTVRKRYFQEIYAMQHADCIYVLNNITKETLVKHLNIPIQKIVLVDNGVNTEIYSPLNSGDVEQIKGRLGLQGKKVFVQIGSVCDRKNQLGALELLTPTLKQDKNSVFIYAGGIIDAEYQERITTYAKEHGFKPQVLYFGEVRPGKSLNELYAISEAMIFPSKSEGFSLVIIEAMAAGVPVIIHESLQFKLAEECCRYRNSSDFQETLKNLILNLEEQMNLSHKVREVVVKNYSWDKIAADYYKSWEVGGLDESLKF